MTTKVSSPGRIVALDYTKGMLVLIMVLYHWINYFWFAQDNRYLRFLTPSFIFITGFIISNIYLTKYGVQDPKLFKRLVERGLKILAVFIGLNVIRSLVLFGRALWTVPSARPSASSLIEVFTIGTGGGGGQSKLLAFFILVPISYLLIISAIILGLTRFYRYAVWIICTLSILSVVGLDLFGLQSPNLELVSIGLLGMIAGSFPIDRVNSFVQHPYWLAVGYLLYLAAITVWNVIYPLQIMGVCLSLMIIYLLGQPRSEPGKFTNCILLLGKYSLFGYIAQIAVLQILRRALNNIDSEALVLVLSFVLGFALTIAAVEAMDRFRAIFRPVDKVYKAIFA